MTTTATTDGLPLFDAGITFEDAQRELLELELGDGLPLVPPTAERLARVLEYSAEPTLSWGYLPPLLGELRPEAVAYQSVLAGCPPAALPLLMTALGATLVHEFNLLGVATTTGTPAVAMVVHGDLAHRLGISSSSNCLGPGAHTNGAIGRALSLCLRNIGGAKEGVGDMATMGQPGKFSFCLAEASDSPYPSLATRRGIADGDDAVTILGVSGTAEVLPIGGAATAESILDPIALAMGSAISVSGARAKVSRGQQVFFLPPELATSLAAKGFDIAAIQHYLFKHARVSAVGDEMVALEHVASSAEDIHAIVVGGPGVKITYPPLWSGGTDAITRSVPGII
ncbi:MAG: hypothetical protein HOI95_16910 [Chromatiales bacterium]|jgi:hypothetical protein|nr:hypothetical protein [Chromatiales bacterium]